MTDGEPRVMGWGLIVVFLVATAICSGLLFGLIGELSGRRMSPAGVGGCVGAVAALLITRRRAALAAAAERRAQK